MKKTTRMKELLLDKRIAVVPSAYDGLSARVIQSVGFEAIHMTGSGSSASLLGAPDIGLATVAEMSIHAKNITQAVDVPVIADADTGYGNALNVIRTIREFEHAGIVGVHIEDQVTPKRCGHLDGKELISAEEMAQKIQAAAEARKDPDFLLIARTDARNQHGLDEAIRRAKVYLEAGADCIFIESPHSPQEMMEIRKQVPGPLLANMVEGGKTPWLTVEELDQLGYNIVIYPLTGWMGAAVIVRELMNELKNTGTTQGFWKRTGMMMTFEELFNVLGYPNWQQYKERFICDTKSTSE
ncbi:isocitrate lyase/PEP mutase family protein [Candidatus Nitrospira neomarina]|uniref:2-methylisocitrate lyase n=1 Tax=Candidatus Nitrospira neomarina TaxID=3020899 RepID=A0AA96GKP6_9BACT|nr:isocitrate lyase/phosphoenolpyruvate mutase family protein [Candidatus Nitrospira neomarina]WNM63142.1 isocitrate lyase/phosphoenolpyruvate mutase family protein [Candidatus Nitrospira neomarina]